MNSDALGRSSDTTPSSDTLTASTTGTAAMPLPYFAALSMTRSITSGVTKGRAPSCISTMSVSGDRPRSARRTLSVRVSPPTHTLAPFSMAVSITRSNSSGAAATSISSNSPVEQNASNAVSSTDLLPMLSNILL